MSNAIGPPLERAQKLADGAATVAVVAAIIVAINAIGHEVAAPATQHLREMDITPDLRGALNLINVLAVFWLLAAPSLFLACGLWDLSRVLNEYSKGQFFTLRASVGVRKAAEWALWALAFKILISPTLVSWITHEGRGFIWRFEPFDLGLIAFASFVMVLGRVLEEAARLKADNDAMV